MLKYMSLIMLHTDMYFKTMRRNIGLGFIYNPVFAGPSPPNMPVLDITQPIPGSPLTSA